MTGARDEVRPSVQRGASVIAVGFGTAVAMWAIGYFGRLPAVMLPGPVLLALLLACPLAGGAALGRHAAAGWRSGALAGLVTGSVNLLVLGSLIAGDAPGGRVPPALVWLPASILLAGLLGGAGALAGRRWLARLRPAGDWVAACVRVAIGAVFLLIVVGGLVTSADAGLAVVDWPNSFGYNMFLYPFSKMTGGIYYEHAHRLFAVLGGLIVATLAVLLQFADPRRIVRGLGWVLLALVLVQALMGGLRVTGGFTTSTAPEAMRPSVALALAHGVLGQLLFAGLVVLGALSAPSWRAGVPPAFRAAPRLDRLLAATLLALLLAQLVLGAARRHLGILLVAHVVLGVAVVAPAALHVGFRAWGANEGHRPLQRSGLALAAAMAVQVALGLGALLATWHGPGAGTGGTAGVVLATAHQAGGAVVLGLAVLLACWTFRPASAPPPAAVP